MSFLNKRLFFVCLLALSACAGSNVENEEPKRSPTSLEEAVGLIVSEMLDEDKDALMDISIMDMYLYHHGWGTGIRNSFGLWTGNHQLLESSCGSITCHPDDASMQILFGVWNVLHNRPIRSKEGVHLITDTIKVIDEPAQP